MWGNDYPHDEGTYPFTRETIRQVFQGVAEGEMRSILGGNAAALYGFDLEALVPYADRPGTDGGRVVRAARRPARKRQPGPPPGRDPLTSTAADRRQLRYTTGGGIPLGAGGERRVPGAEQAGVLKGRSRERQREVVWIRSGEDVVQVQKVLTHRVVPAGCGR